MLTHERSLRSQAHAIIVEMSTARIGSSFLGAFACVFALDLSACGGTRVRDQTDAARCTSKSCGVDSSESGSTDTMDTSSIPDSGKIDRPVSDAGRTGDSRDPSDDAGSEPRPTRPPDPVDYGAKDIENLTLPSATATASFVGERDTIAALQCNECGGKEPADSDDKSLPRFTWFNHQGTEEWVQYDFAEPTVLSGAGVYWFVDDRASLLPVSWQLSQRDDNGKWEPIAAAAGYPIERDRYNWVKFDRITTRAIRLTAKLPPNKSAGILRWKVFDAPLPRPLLAFKSSTGILNHDAILQSYGRSERPWHRANIPFFDAPDAELRDIYYFRFWNYRQNIQLEATSRAWVVREGASYGITVCPAGHHIYEGRWLRNPEYVDDTIRYWFTEGQRRAYGNWLADGVFAHYLVHGKKEPLAALLPALEGNFAGWEQEHFDAERGLFKWIPDRDGMEASLAGFEEGAATNFPKGTVLFGGEGYRPSLNSYMFAELRAIARTAELAGDRAKSERYGQKAQQLKDTVQRELWNEQLSFFVQRRASDYGFVGGRELIGYFPWAFGVADFAPARVAAWSQLMNEQGFSATYGPTTLERRNPYFMREFDHPTTWNGPSWPYSTSLTLAAMANLLQETDQKVVSRTDYWETFRRYTATHYDPNGTPTLRENHHPTENRWLAQGANYNHSRFTDLVITGLVGLRPRADSMFELHPLAPETWNYFCLEDLRYHGHLFTIVWDRDGSQYGRGRGLRVFRDGVLLFDQPELAPLTFKLPD